MSDWLIPLSDLDYGPEELAAVQRVVESKWLSMGPEVAKFEAEFAEFLQAPFAVATSSATAALHLSLVSAGIGPGDEVIQPALNFVAAANMTLAAGAVPVFADIVSLAEPTIDPESVARLIGPRTKAVIGMHYGGHPCRLDQLRELSAQHQLLLIEDACHAVGARYSHASNQDPHNEAVGQMTGTVGDISAFSFFSNKNLATGEGGMLVTGNAEFAELARRLRSHGMTSLTWDRHRGHASSYDVVNNGYNYRLDELHAALGRVQLAKLSANNERRCRLLARYHERFSTLTGWIVPFVESSLETSAHLMVAVAPTPEIRGQVVEGLRAARIQTSMHYPSIASFSAFQSCRADALRNSDDFASRAISLPIFPTMTSEQVDEVCEVLRACAS